MSWGFLTKILEELHKHSTIVGKIWLTMFIILRIVVTAVVGESIYYDEHSMFTCNTMQPGCKNVCYNQFAPISYVRFWAFQIVIVATPPVLYLCYAVDRVARLKCRKDDGLHDGQDQTVEKRRKKHQDRWKSKVQESGREQVYHDGPMCAYVLQLVIRFGLECGFLVLQFLLFGLAVPPIYVCAVEPCPYQVDCFISRSMERTIFLIFTYIVILLGLLLNIWEILNLGLFAMLDIFRSKPVDPAALSSPSSGSFEGSPTSAEEAEETDDGVNRCGRLPFTYATPSPTTFAIVMEQEPKLICTSGVGARMAPRHNDLANHSLRRDQEPREANWTPKSRDKKFKLRRKKRSSSKKRPVKSNRGQSV